MSSGVTEVRERKDRLKQLKRELERADERARGLVEARDQLGAMETALRGEAERMASGIKWSPYAGMKMAGEVHATYLRGSKIYQKGELLAPPGTGRFLRREH